MAGTEYPGIHGCIAKDMYADADYRLDCKKCGNSFPLPEYRFGEFLATGWPKCCGQTMLLNRQEQP